MSVVGLDMGNQNSAMATAGRGGVDMLLNGNSNRLNATMAAFSQTIRSCGESASSTATSNWKNSITSMKRLIGLKFSDPRAQLEIEHYCPFTCVESKENGGVSILVAYENEEKTVTIEHATAMMLAHMSSVSSAANQGTVPQDWVIGIPPYYNDSQRRGILDACEIVGINTQRLLHETTATALSYGIFKDIKKEFKENEPTYVMFIDFGQSAYLVSIVSYSKAKLTVKSTQYDIDLGGRDIDVAIANFAVAEFVKKYPKASNPRNNKKAWLKLLSAAEKAKKTLSPTGVKEARMSLECLIDELDFNCTLSTEKYIEIIQPLLNRLEAPIRRALDESKIPIDMLSSVELVGGGSRVAQVKMALAAVMKTDVTLTNFGLSTTMNADESVARGCALQSAILSPRFKVMDYEIVERQIHDVVVEWEGEAVIDDEEKDGENSAANNGNSVIMFEKGSNFPSTRRVTLKKAGDFTVSCSYSPHSEESKFTLDPGAPLKICTLNIKNDRKEATKIRVNIKQDISGIVTLSSAQAMEEVVVDTAAEAEKVAAAAASESKEEGKEENKEEGKEENKEAEAASEMNVDEPAASGEPTPAVAPKRKFKKVSLQFTVDAPSRFTKPQMDSIIEQEARMANSDRVVIETSAKRNELEAYLYSMRDRINRDLKDFSTDTEREHLKKALEEGEEWLYTDEGFDGNKSVFTEKLKSIQKYAEKTMKRFDEAQTRQASIASFQSQVETYKSFVHNANNDAKFAHITDDERKQMRTGNSEAEAWLFDLIEKQGNTPLSSDAVLTRFMIKDKLKVLTDLVTPIMNKPVPLPTKEEEEAKKAAAEAAAAAAAAAEEAKGEEEKGSEPMETDAETAIPAVPAAEMDVE